MRLIDSDGLKAKVEAKVEHSVNENDYEFGCNQTLDYVADILIDEAPTIDAVEVVRCKNCKYGEERIKDYRCWMLDEDWDIRFSPMHFCSFGERREDGEV